MTNNFVRFYIIVMLFFSFSTLFGQREGRIKKVTEERIRYKGIDDSITLHHKTFKYNEKGLLIGKQEFYYNMTPAGSLAKDINAQYNKDKQLLIENIITFKSNNEKIFENLRTKYLVYGATEEDSKYIWRQYIDNTLDIVREDTLTYDENLNLLERCDFNYKGNTSLACDEYKYDKDNHLRRWRMYTYWTTVKAGGKTVDKREKKQDYKYFYNGKGQHTKTKGKRYSTKYSEKFSYNKAGILVAYQERNFRKSKHTKKRRKETKKKFSTHEEIRERTFNDYGKVLSETYTRDNKVFQKLSYVYERDSLLTNYEMAQKGKTVQTISFFYDENKQLIKKITYSHDNKGVMRFFVQADYNDKNQLVRETQTAKEKVLKQNIFEYNEYGDKISTTMFFKNNKKFEKTLYFYEYY